MGVSTNEIEKEEAYKFIATRKKGCMVGSDGSKPPIREVGEPYWSSYHEWLLGIVNNAGQPAFLGR